MVSSLVDLTRALLPAVDASCRKNSAIGCHARAQMALKQLHTVDKKFEYTDQLMVCAFICGNGKGFIAYNGGINKITLLCDVNFSFPHWDPKKEHLKMLE